VTNGEGYLFETEITLASDSKCTVKMLRKKPNKIPFAPGRRHKMNDRYEWFLEKGNSVRN
jgi:16S rRNA (uracil1498-N3)-methyltransferase